MRAQKRLGQLHVRLRRLGERRAFTDWHISGSASPTPRQWQLARLAQGTPFWCVWPVVLALSAVPPRVVWVSWWLDVLADIPSERLAVRVVTDE